MPVFSEAYRCHADTKFPKSWSSCESRVKQWFPRDPGQAGVDQAESHVQMLSGYRVEAVRQTGSKETRAAAAASQANIGRVGMLRAEWNAVLIDELGAFPFGAHDDIVDALSLVFNQMAGDSTLNDWMRL